MADPTTLKMASLGTDLAATIPNGTPPVSLASVLAGGQVLPGDGAAGDDFVSLRDMPSTTAAMRALDIDETANPYDYLIGTTLDERYLVERIIGEGGMGVVLLAHHVLLEKPVAIKVLKRDVAHDQEVVTRFLREARAASTIGHANIVEFTDFGTTPDGLTYSVMEYVEGPTLDQVLADEGPFAPARALPIARKLAEALTAAHARNIVHRDLKPENIFLYNIEGGRDQIKIVDFGIAKILAASQQMHEAKITADGTVFGTPEYMAPEQAAGKPDIDHRVDIYSLGIILYQMLTDVVPHKSGNAMRTLAMRVLDPIAPMAETRPELRVSPDLEALVASALEREPSARLSSMDEFLTRLEKLPDEGRASRAAASPALPADDTLDHLATTPYLGRVDDLMASYPEFGERRSAGAGTKNGPNTAPEPASSQPRVLPVLALLLAALAGGVVGFLLFSGGDESDSSRPAVPAHSVDARMTKPAPERQNGEKGDSRPDDTRSLTNGPDSSTPDNSSRNGTGDGQHTPGSDNNPDQKPDATPDVTPEAGRTGDNPVAKPPKKNPRKPPVKPEGKRPAPKTTDPTIARRPVTVTVLAQPNHASLYVNHNYSGKGGTTFERPEGTKLTVECRAKGYETGRVKVRFDGATEVVLCQTKRIPQCVDGLKNPFDKCPD